MLTMLMSPYIAATACWTVSSVLRHVYLTLSKGPFNVTERFALWCELRRRLENKRRR